MRRDGDRDVHKMRQRFGGIQRFTAADTQYGATLTFLGDGAQPVVICICAAKRAISTDRHPSGFCAASSRDPARIYRPQRQVVRHWFK